MSDPETLAVYQARSPDYARMVAKWETPGLERFIGALPEGADVLELGCGPGLDAKKMMEAGVNMDAVDATPAMVATAREIGVTARQMRFDELDAVETYDGVWANFSLLHAPRSDFPTHLAAIHRALKPGGLLHLGMKLGEGEGRDRLGRFYTYNSEEALLAHLSEAGFTMDFKALGQGKGFDGTPSPWIWMQAHG